MFISDNGLKFSFFVILLSRFGIRVMVVLWKKFGSFFLFAVLKKKKFEDGCQLFSRHLVEFICEAIWS